MSEKVFISGSISIKSLSQDVCSRLENIIAQNIQVLVGDALGIDTLVQEFFASKDYYNVTVYSVYENPRSVCSSKFYNEIVVVSDNIKKEREKQIYKDKKMTEDSNYSFIIWDKKSKGSYGNIIRALELKKKIIVYLNDDKSYLPKDKCSIPEIEFIYRQYNGYTASEVVDYFKREQIEKFSSTRDLHKFLLEKGIIVKSEKKYAPSPVLSQDNIDSYFIHTKYKGRDTRVSYTNDLIEWIQQEINKSKIEENNYQQNTLF